MAPKNHIGRELLSKKNRARFLIVVKGYNQKEAAALVGISEKTMGKWVKRYNWNEASDKELMKLGGLSSIMDGFIDFVKSHMPTDFSGKVEKLWGKYLEGLQQKASNV